MIEVLKDLVDKAHFKKAPEMVFRTKKDFAIAVSDLKPRQAIDSAEVLRLEKLEKFHLISSCYGKIKALLLTIPDWVLYRDDYLKVYKNLIVQLPPYTKFLIYIDEKSKEALNSLLIELNVADRTEIIPVVTSTRFTVWAQDAFVICSDIADNRYFVEPPVFLRLDDHAIADNIAAVSHYKTRTENLYFQGGNILVGDDEWIIGYDYPNNSFKHNYIVPEGGESKIDAIRRGYKRIDYSRCLFPVGSSLEVPVEMKVGDYDFGDGRYLPLYAYKGNEQGTVQPIFHIDMFITMAGQDAAGKKILLVADPSITKALLPGNETVQYLHQFSMQEIFDHYARKFQRLGFRVIRNPISLAIGHQPEDIEWKVAEHLFIYFATSNNAIVEIAGDSKKVWLPSYGHGNFAYLTVVDQENKKIWESLGFEVTLLEDFHPFAEKLGAVHCITKFLDRELPAPF